MPIRISQMRMQESAIWDRFASNHDHGTPYQLAAWRSAIVSSYSHETCYLIATSSPGDASASVIRSAGPDTIRPASMGEDSVAGILPLVHIRHWLFGDSLVSMPFCDAGGVLANDDVVERMLVEHSLRTADARHVPEVVLRQYQPLSFFGDQGFTRGAVPSGPGEIRAVPGWRVSMARDSNKVRMLLELPGSPEALMRSFGAKLRSQIRKPQKNGLAVKAGGAELINDFYDVFAVNMRDLGSPVHSKKFILQILENNPERARIFIVYGQGMPMACSLTLSFNGILSNPWASSLRRFSQLSPNMLLYWAMLEFACQQSCRQFDFGRSTVGEGTYRFKEQWGARPAPLYWYRFAKDQHASEVDQDNSRMMRAVEVWKRLPVPVTRLLGPMIRRYISL